MIYLDNAATTKPSEKALYKASVYNCDKFFNPSALYLGGVEANKELNVARDKILSFLGLNNRNYQVIFTSCGSESDNLAIFCAKKRGVFVTDKGEHSAVYKSFLELKQRGLETVLINLNNDGSVNQEELFKFVRSNKVDFVSIMHVNNETGAINDVNFIADTIKTIDKNIIFHCDGVQAYGKIPFVMSQNIDFYSISAHKVNGLKGVGALIRKKSTTLLPNIFGGGQEFGFRSGTENVFGIKVLEFASEEHYLNIRGNFDYISKLNSYIKDNLDCELFHVISGENASPYILSVSAKGLKGEVLMHSLEQDGIILGNGSACSSKHRFSRVIEACGYKQDVLDGVLRISFCVENTFEEVTRLVERMNYQAKKLKRIM